MFLSNKANKMLLSLNDYDDKSTNRRKMDQYMLSALGKNWCSTVEFVWITGEQEIVSFFVRWNVLLRWMDGSGSRLAESTSCIVISVEFKLEK